MIDTKLGPSLNKKLFPRYTKGIGILEDEIFCYLEVHLFYVFCLFHATILAMLVGPLIFSFVFISDAV